MKIQYSAISETGLKRRQNEDCYTVFDFKEESRGLDIEGGVFAVADGMGGHPCGEVASLLACRGIKAAAEIAVDSPEEMQERLAAIFHDIDKQLRQYSFSTPSCEDMGTTLSVLALIEEKAIIAHVGDCRIFLYRDQKLVPLTKDHTFVQDLVDQCFLTPEEAFSHPYRNKLTQAIGTADPLDDVDTRVVDLCPSDTFLLSSDGLHDVLTTSIIEKILHDSKKPEQAVQHLLSTALEQGGKDDITIIVIETQPTSRLEHRGD